MSYFNNNFENNNDVSSQRGIIVLVIILLLLGGFFIWYQFRFSSSQLAFQAPSDTKTGFLSNSSAITQADDDGDGLSNQEEEKIQTNSQQADSDGDNLSDGEEVRTYGTNPRQADSDGDGINDGDEIKNRHNPLDPAPTAVWPPVPSSLPIIN